MIFKLEHFILYFLFIIIYKTYANSSDISFNNNNKTEKIEYGLSYLTDNKNIGCTGSTEKKLINGEKIIKNFMLANKFQLNKRRFLIIKSSFNREFRIYFFKSSDHIISNDFYRILYKCAEASSGKPYLVNICVNKYFKKYKVDFSSSCLSCFTDFIGCAFIYCNEKCSRDQCSNKCKECTKKNCFKKLLSCTKLDKLFNPCD